MKPHDNLTLAVATIVLSLASQVGAPRSMKAGIPGASCGSQVNPDSRRTDPRKPDAAFGALPIPAQAGISGVLGRDLEGYEMRAGRTTATYKAANAKQGLSADFTPLGVELHRSAANWEMAVRGYGYGASLMPVGVAAPQARLNRVDYHRGNLTEWYVNGPLGVEQGFTLQAPPAHVSPQGSSERGPLTVAIDLTGNEKAALDAGGSILTLFAADSAGSPLRYSGLSAHDAGGVTLKAWMELASNQLLLEVDDRAARYPVTIDPILQVAKLTSSDGAASDDFGWAVAANSSTIVVGVGSTSKAEAYVFAKPESGWGNMTETATLTPSDGESSFGGSVAISGNTIVVGAPYAGNYAGAVYVFVEPAGGWTNMTETAKLTTSGGGSKFMGWSVAIDGNTLVAGAPDASFKPNLDQGASYVFVEPAAGWKTTSSANATLTASDSAAYDSQGSSVAISGNTIVAGAWQKSAVYLYLKPAGGWVTATQNAKLTSTLGDAGLGVSVATNGNTVVGGAPDATLSGGSFQGAAVVWVKPAGGWMNSTETADLTASDAAEFDLLGGAVALSGNVIMAGQDGYLNSEPGAAYLYIEPVGGWANMTQSAKIAASDGAADDHFGYSVAVVGRSAVAGAYGANIGANASQGAAYVFIAHGLD